MKGFPEFKSPPPPEPLPTNWERYASGEKLAPTYKRVIPKTRIAINQSKVIKTKPLAIRQGVDISLFPLIMLFILAALWIITGLKYFGILA